MCARNCRGVKTSSLNSIPLGVKARSSLQRPMKAHGLPSQSPFAEPSALIPPAEFAGYKRRYEISACAVAFGGLVPLGGQAAGSDGRRSFRRGRPRR